MPSNTVTANRSQQSSHQSMESLSQVYNQSLRFKFGSAPAQLITKGFVAEKSLEKRSYSIRKEIEDSNNVSVKSQLSQHISKAAERGTESPEVSTRQGMKSKSADFNTIINGTVVSKSQKSYRTASQNLNHYGTNDKLINDSPDSSENEDKKDDDQLSLSARSKRSSNVSSSTSMQQKSKIQLPLLNLRSPPSDLSEKNINFEKKKASVVLPSIA